MHYDTAQSLMKKFMGTKLLGRDASSLCVSFSDANKHKSELKFKEGMTCDSKGQFRIDQTFARKMFFGSSISETEKISFKFLLMKLKLKILG